MSADSLRREGGGEERGREGGESLRWGAMGGERERDLCHTQRALLEERERFMSHTESFIRRERERDLCHTQRALLDERERELYVTHRELY